jgi:hypothetical protein
MNAIMSNQPLKALTRFAIVSAIAISPALNATTHDVTGTWHATFVGDPMTFPKMLSEMQFDFDGDGDGEKVTGMAHLGHWPGDAPLSNGRIEGDRLTFTVIGRLPWCSSFAGQTRCGYPRLDFTGIIRNGQMALSLDWGSIIDGREVSAADWPGAGFNATLELDATRLTTAK